MGSGVHTYIYMACVLLPCGKIVALRVYTLYETLYCRKVFAAVSLFREVMVGIASIEHYLGYRESRIYPSNCVMFIQEVQLDLVGSVT
jgi:hypothetical protein